MERQLFSLSRRLASSTISTRPYICRRCITQEVTRSERKPLSEAQLARRDWVQAYLGDPLESEPEEHKLRTVEFLGRDLAQDLPSQYLMYINPVVLTPKEKEQRDHMYKWAMVGRVDSEGLPKKSNASEIKGVVVSAGLMDRTVKVRIPGQRWEPRIKKYYATHTDHLVSDPNNSLLEGDIVILHRLHVAKTVRHVIGSVAVPYGKPLDQRPHIWTPEERLALYKEKRINKAERSTLRKKVKAGDEEALIALKTKGIDATALLPKQRTSRPPSEEFTVGAKAAQKKAKYNEQTARNTAQAKEKLEELHEQGLDTPTKVA